MFFKAKVAKIYLKVIKYTGQGCVILKTLWRRNVVLIKKKKSHFSLSNIFCVADCRGNAPFPM